MVFNLQSCFILHCAQSFLWVLSDIWKPVKTEDTRKWHLCFISKWDLCPSVILTNVLLSLCQPFPLVKLFKGLLPITIGIPRKDFCSEWRKAPECFSGICLKVYVKEVIFEQQDLLKQMSNFYCRRCDIPNHKPSGNILLLSHSLLLNLDLYVGGRHDDLGLIWHLSSQVRRLINHWWH